MSQVVAFEFDRVGLRAAVVEEGAPAPKIKRLVSVQNPSLETADAIAAALRDALPDVRWSRIKLVALVGGDQVRCRLLKLPPCPDNELPDLVRMQATREFALTEQAPVDFVPVSSSGEAGRSVLASTIAVNDYKEILAVARILEAPLERISTRGGAAASLAMSIDPSLREGSHMVVAAAAGAADLVVLENSAPSLLRTSRVPSDAAAAVVASEARRTGAMASQQTGQRIDSTKLLGYTPDKGPLEALDASGFLMERHGLSADQAPLAAELFGVIGAALDESREARPYFDFLNPRRPVVDHSGQHRKILYGALAAAALLIGLGLAYARVWSKERQIAETKAAVAAEQKKLDKWRPVREQADAVEAWLASDVNWLDEFEQIGQRIRPVTLDKKPDEFLQDEDAYLVSLSAVATPQRGGDGGKIEVRARSRQSITYGDVEDRLRDERHQVNSRQGTTIAGERNYPWEVMTSIEVSKPADDEEAAK